MSESTTCSQCIEEICEQGCTAVRDVIVKLERDQQVEGLDHLDDVQKHIILKELKAVMSVYDQ